MRFFVSYARRDNSADALRQIAAMVPDATSIYIDDLETHAAGVDRVKKVVDALMSADVFIAVQSTHYLKTEWTRWEFETALQGRAEIRALLTDGEFAHWGDPGWPWSSDETNERVVSAAR
ncbi:TIR domain-containing protein [Streptomyces microflavus]|uniref:TIR domain-containing protein n=1 Tax=Streptomyces TaxID=1883 RepID=UPI0036EFE4E0